MKSNRQPDSWGHSLKAISLFAVVFMLIISLYGCNLVEDQGLTVRSDTTGYLLHTNKTLNVSVLVPESWESKVSIGGELVMRPPQSKGEAISVASSTVEWLMGEGTPSSTTLDEYRAFRLSHINEEEIGPNFTVSQKKTSLSGHDAYEVRYSMQPSGEAQYYVFRETFTVVGGKVYRLYYGGTEDVFNNYLDELEVVKESYRILQ